jgi:hypothetical protein
MLAWGAIKTIRRRRMSFQNKRFTFTCDENTYMKMQRLSGKASLQLKDFQIVLENLINYAYEKSNGKAVK